MRLPEGEIKRHAYAYSMDLGYTKVPECDVQQMLLRSLLLEGLRSAGSPGTGLEDVVENETLIGDVRVCIDR